jgi:hypothetical protein
MNKMKDYIDSLSKGLVMCDTPPPNAVTGDRYINTNDYCVNVYDGNEWVLIDGGGYRHLEIIKEKRNNIIDELLLESKDDEIERLKK